MSSQKITDLTYLESISMDDEGLVAEMINLFLENSPLMLKNLNAFYEEGDFKKLSAEAHKYKPTLSYMGMENAKEILVEIEESAKSKTNTDQILEKIRFLEEQCNQAKFELTEALKQIK